MGIAPWQRSLWLSRLSAAGLGLSLAACGGAGEAVEYPRGRPIHLSNWVVRVEQVEAVEPRLLAGYDDFRVDETEATVLAVHLEFRPEEETPGGKILSTEERRFLKLMGAFRLRDGEGAEYRFGLPLPDLQYRMLKEARSGRASWPTSSPDAGRWVLLFAVPKESRGFSLLIRNSGREGEPRLAVVPLGR